MRSQNLLQKLDSNKASSIMSEGTDAAVMGVPIAAQATNSGAPSHTQGVDSNDAELQERLSANDKQLTHGAYGQVDAPPEAKRVEDGPLPDRKGFNPYQESGKPAWEQVKPNGQNKGGRCIIA